ncbi:unnamed protein product [Ascophyllum nodosum]
MSEGLASSTHLSAAIALCGKCGLCSRRKEGFVARVEAAFFYPKRPYYSHSLFNIGGTAATTTHGSYHGIRRTRGTSTAGLPMRQFWHLYERVAVLGQGAPTNEDRAIRFDDMVSELNLAPRGTRGPLACLYGVFDGHGGEGASNFVSNHLHHLIGRNPYYESIDYPADEALASAVEDGIASVEQAYTHWAKRSGDTSGCCACVVAIRGSVLCAANVGDCQAILITEKGIHVPLSRPHRASSVDEKARIQQSGGKVIDGRAMGVLEPSRVIGDVDVKRKWPNVVISDPYVMVRRLDYKRGQGPSYLVIASDGVWDSIVPTKVSELVNASFEKQKTPYQVSRELVMAAREAGSGDDVTAVVAKLG